MDRKADKQTDKRTERCSDTHTYKSSFHVIAECPATQTLRTRVFELPIPKCLPNPPDWTVSQLVRFLKESSVGDMLDQD